MEVKVEVEVEDVRTLGLDVTEIALAETADEE